MIHSVKAIFQLSRTDVCSLFVRNQFHGHEFNISFRKIKDQCPGHKDSHSDSQSSVVPSRVPRFPLGVSTRHLTIKFSSRQDQLTLSMETHLDGRELHSPSTLQYLRFVLLNGTRLHLVLIRNFHVLFRS